MPEICLKSGCLLKAAHDGFCIKHAAGAFLAGRGVQSRSAAAGSRLAFIKRALATSTDECILFPFSANQATWLGRQWLATRLACQLSHGTPEFDGMMAIHSCGNGHLWCVNPRHLSWGDAQDNGDDASMHYACGKKRAEPMTADDIKNARRRSKHRSRARRRRPIRDTRPEYDLMPLALDAFIA